MMTNGPPDQGGPDAAGTVGSVPERDQAEQRPYRKTNRTASPKAPLLNEPLVIDRFWRNRRGEAIVTSLEPYEGRIIVHVRTFYTDSAGKLLPTKKGVCFSANRLPDLLAAVTKAAAKARELGLIDRDE